jgi:hypothetical protein
LTSQQALQSTRAWQLSHYARSSTSIDDDGDQLFDATEKTNTGGTYRFFFHERKTDTVDNMLSNFYETLDAFGAWDDCDVRFRYLIALPKVNADCLLDKPFISIQAQWYSI